MGVENKIKIKTKFLCEVATLDSCNNAKVNNKLLRFSSFFSLNTREKNK
jgi:hypothetical protein